MTRKSLSLYNDAKLILHNPELPILKEKLILKKNYDISLSQGLEIELCFRKLGINRCIQ